MKASRITAVTLVAAATGWIASGYLFPREHAVSHAAITVKEGAAQKLFRVAVSETVLAPHSRKLVLSGRTEADRKVMAVARTGGVLTELRVKRGDRVEKGDVLAVLSDEAREAQVAQARALLLQKKAELEARRKLVENGTMPRLDLGNLEAHAKAAEAGLAAAEAERDRGVVRAPWSGIVTDTTAEVGQAAFSMVGREIAQIVALDPMLAVVEVAERKLAGVKVGDLAEVRLVTGQTATGKIRFVSKIGEPDHPHLPGRGRDAESRRHDPRRHHLRGRNPDGAGHGGARAALGADAVVFRGDRGACRQRRGRGRLPAGLGGRGQSHLHVDGRAAGRRAGDRPGTGLRARRPARRGRARPDTGPPGS